MSETQRLAARNRVRRETAIPVTRKMGYAIAGIYGFYGGTWTKKRDAISFHCEAKGRTWPECFQRGDRCERVIIMTMETYNREIHEAYRKGLGEKKKPGSAGR